MVWNAATFDPELTACLTAHTELIVGYFARANAVFLAYDMGRDRGLIRPDNAFAEDFSRLRDEVDNMMGARAIRAWHYTRLTDRRWRS